MLARTVSGTIIGRDDSEPEAQVTIVTQADHHPTCWQQGNEHSNHQA